MRNRAPNSNQYAFCVISEDILLYKKGELSDEKRQEISSHLNTERCKRCRDLYLSTPVSGSDRGLQVDLSVLKRPEILEQRRVSFEAPSSSVESGQVWTTKTGDRPYGVPVLVVSVGEWIIRVIPLSLDVEFHEYPLTVTLTEEPLGYEVLAEVFNERPTSRDLLENFRGNVSQEKMSELFEARKNFLEGNVLETDPEWREWGEFETRYSSYLSDPINAMLVDE